MNPADSEPKYLISVIAKLLGVHPQTLRMYERMGLIQPSRSQGNMRYYSEDDIQRFKRILTLTRHMGVNLAGVEIIIRLQEQLQDLTDEFQELLSGLREEYTKEGIEAEEKFDLFLGLTTKRLQNRRSE
jgi:MerR family transcriptional regulator, heat shock protein HspR